MTDLLASAFFRMCPGVALDVSERWTRVTASPRSVGKYAGLVEEALRAVDSYDQPTAAQLTRLPAVRSAEEQLMRFGSVEYLRSLQCEPSGIGLSPVLAAVARGRGVILGCTHIGLFHHALIQTTRLDADILVVTGNESYSPVMVERLCEVSGARIRLVSAATASALAVARHLRRGGVVATMLDLYVRSTLQLPVPFFGRSAATPAGIFQLAVATGAPIVPLCVETGANGHKTVKIETVLAPGSSVLELAVRTNACIETMVRRHVSSWSVWPSLLRRWSLVEGSFR